MSILLDTNACIAAIAGRPPLVAAKIAWALENREQVSVSAISLFELWYGIAKSARPERNTQTLQVFLAPMSVIMLDDEDGRFAGVIRADLERRGTPIGPYDLLIAGQAIRHDMTLVTANVREFSRIEGLRWEDWSLPA